MITKKPPTYQQKKRRLEKLVEANKQPQHICYLCLVSFPNKPELIKEHLSSNKHQAVWKIYWNKKFLQN